MIFDSRIGGSQQTPPASCRDRGWLWSGCGGLVPVPRADAIHLSHVCVTKPGRIRWQRGTGTRPPHPPNLSPCPYSYGASDLHDMMMPVQEAFTKQTGETRYESCVMQGIWDAGDAGDRGGCSSASGQGAGGGDGEGVRRQFS